MVAALQTAVICYGLQKFYQTFSRTWIVVKAAFNMVKSKVGRKEKEADEKEDIRLKIRKSSLKRFGKNTIINSVAKTCN